MRKAFFLFFCSLGLFGWSDLAARSAAEPPARRATAEEQLRPRWQVGQSWVVETTKKTAHLADGASASAGGVDLYGPNEKAVLTVKVTDSDLHSAVGAKALALRVRVAAAEVCGGDDNVIRFSDGFIKCQAASIDRAIAELNSPLVADALGRPLQNLARYGR